MERDPGLATLVAGLSGKQPTPPTTARLGAIAAPAENRPQGVPSLTRQRMRPSQRIRSLVRRRQAASSEGGGDAARRHGTLARRQSPSPASQSPGLPAGEGGGVLLAVFATNNTASTASRKPSRLSCLSAERGEG